MGKRSLVQTAAVAAEAKVPESPVPDAVVEEVATEVATLVRRAELKCAFEVGRLVAERFFAGNAEAWHRPGPKHEALGRLADRLHARGAGSASALHVCLGVYETYAALGDIPARECLTKTHVRTVLPLPMPARLSLLREAERCGWTVRELEAAAAPQLPPHRRGRHPQPRFLRGIARLEAVLAGNGLAFQELEKALELDPEAREATYARLVRVAGRVEALRLRLSPKRIAALGAGPKSAARRRTAEGTDAHRGPASVSP